MELVPPLGHGIVTVLDSSFKSRLRSADCFLKLLKRENAVLIHRYMFQVCAAAAAIFSHEVESTRHGALAMRCRGRALEQSDSKDFVRDSRRFGYALGGGKSPKHILRRLSAE